MNQSVLTIPSYISDGVGSQRHPAFGTGIQHDAACLHRGRAHCCAAPAAYRSSTGAGAGRTTLPAARMPSCDDSCDGCASHACGSVRYARARLERLHCVKHRRHFAALRQRCCEPMELIMSAEIALVLLRATMCYVQQQVPLLPVEVQHLGGDRTDRVAAGGRILPADPQPSRRSQTDPHRLRAEPKKQHKAEIGAAEIKSPWKVNRNAVCHNLRAEQAKKAKS